MKVRQFAMRAVCAVAVAAAATMGAASAASAETVPLPTFWPYSPINLTLGQNAWCNGIVDSGIETDPAKPGFVTAVLSSRGMHGVGPEWAQNPHCKVTWVFRADNGLFSKTPPMAIRTEFGEQPESVRKEFWVGSGFTGFTIGATFLDPETQQLIPQVSYLGGFAFAIVP
ncbi:hypothetical protein OG921_02195 [Aldersonia sp. NBC_00410]|uniref:hypothetical protein n=1 Tax=Aldersonia sp. NBC_00410 TaxID=2975954 RepID=UPI0022547CE2|nr:hypothetical protein [Aldersonia sp. NBC_00410]MCX5042005.1 hypothetical protein [Aldersonia sp. NBC_00410]